MRKRILFTLLCLFGLSAGMHAQLLLKGDMNSDQQITFIDVMYLANTVAGAYPVEYIDISQYADRKDNTKIAATWQASGQSAFTFNSDGTTDYPNGATYEYYPLKDRILIFGSSGATVQTFNLLKVTDTYFVAIDFATNAITYYYKSSN